MEIRESIFFCLLFDKNSENREGKKRIIDIRNTSAYLEKKKCIYVSELVDDNIHMVGSLFKKMSCERSKTHVRILFFINNLEFP